jgi:hypothetical protein
VKLLQPGVPGATRLARAAASCEDIGRALLPQTIRGSTPIVTRERRGPSPHVTEAAAYRPGVAASHGRPALCEKNYLRCPTYLAVSLWASLTSNSTFPRDEGRQNAFRHCIWQAILTFKLGHQTAQEWGNAHEMDQPPTTAKST